MLTLTPCAATLGATIEGVRLGELGQGEWETIHRAFHDHAVLIFPGQHLGRVEQGAFARRFGDLEVGLMGDQPVIEIANTDGSGALRSEDHPVYHVLRGNEGWHTDSSYMPVAAKASVLSAVVVPPEGGATEWADMRAGYEALDAQDQDLVADLAARHSLRYSQARAGQAQTRGYGIDVDVEPLRPLVKVHPVTGRPALFVGRHAHAIVGMEEAASEALLDRLTAGACRPPRIHRHQWKPGDVVVWDNRCVLHRARPFDARHARVMWHTRVAGDPRTEAGVESDE